MFRIITPLLLILAAIGLFFVFSDPLYTEVKDLRLAEQGYNQALLNSRQLKETRDELLSRYNSFKTQDISRLEKMVPDSVENIRLIIEIENIAVANKMSLSDILFESEKSQEMIEGGEMSDTFDVVTPEEVALANNEYEVFSFDFSANGTYEDFINFVQDLERNLRILDINSIKFSSDTTGENGSINYKYDFSVTTYWLKK